MATVATLEEIAPHLASLPIGASSTFWMDCLHYFVIIRTIGQGSFGRVYLVRNIISGGFYALKVMKKSRILAQHQLQHVKDEVALLKTVDCPYVVKLERTFQDQENLYLLLEYVPGGELFSLLRQRRRMTREMATFYVREIVVALEYLHRHDIAYRDLKPENILIDRWGHVKLVDFGFAKKVPSVTWTMCGTPEYLAPEVIKGTGHGCSVDWWSLGVLLYELMAGYSPFFAPENQQIYENVLHGRLSFPSHFDFETRDLISGLLTQDKSYRTGNLVGGASDVLGHPFFRSTDWQSIRNHHSSNTLGVFGLQPLGSSRPPTFAFENNLEALHSRKDFGTPPAASLSSQPMLNPMQAFPPHLGAPSFPPLHATSPQNLFATPTAHIASFAPSTHSSNSPLPNILQPGYKPSAIPATLHSPGFCQNQFLGAMASSAPLHHPHPHHQTPHIPSHFIPMKPLHEGALTPEPPANHRGVFDPHRSGQPFRSLHEGAEEVESVQSEAYPSSSSEDSSMDICNRSYSCPPSSHHMDLSENDQNVLLKSLTDATSNEKNEEEAKATLESINPPGLLPVPSFVKSEEHGVTNLESRSPVPPIELQVSQLFLNADSFSDSPMVSPHPSDTSETNLDTLFPEDVELNMDASPDLPEEPNDTNDGSSTMRFCMSVISPHIPPWIPNIDFLGDSSHFDAYDDDPEVRVPLHHETCRFPCLLHPIPYFPSPIQTEHGVVWPHSTILSSSARQNPAATAYGKPPHLPPAPPNDLFIGF